MCTVPRGLRTVSEPVDTALAVRPVAIFVLKVRLEASQHGSLQMARSGQGGLVEHARSLRGRLQQHLVYRGQGHWHGVAGKLQWAPVVVH